MRYVFILVFILLVMTACNRSATNTADSSAGKRYPLKGKVVSVDRGAKKAKVDHEAIEGFMPAMTMDFPIHADWVWDNLTPGSEIRAELVVNNAAAEPYWLENIGIVAAALPGQTATAEDNEKFVQIGKEAPEFSLTNQDGKKISLKGFRGKALAITFIYAQCPLPEYCIKMSTNFSDLAHQVNADAELKDQVRLLSISFDPANDTPAKLRSYGLGYMGKGATELGVWQLAVGTDAEVRRIADFFGLRYEVDATDKTQINHSLRTAVIAPDGKVTKIFAGNDWTIIQLLEELKSSLRQAEN